jgi:four helix bundle protein
LSSGDTTSSEIADLSSIAIYQRLRAWDRCHQLGLAVYQATNSWPPGERFGLTSQARRAAHSAAANIAEGAAKRGSREFRRYLDISLGSLSELSYALLLARDLKILSDEEWGRLEKIHQNAGGMTWLLYKSLSAKSVPAPI